MFPRYVLLNLVHPCLLKKELHTPRRWQVVWVISRTHIQFEHINTLYPCSFPSTFSFHIKKNTHTRTHNQPCSLSPLLSLQLSSSSQSRSLLDPSTHVSIAASTRPTRPNLSNALTNGALPLAPTKQNNKHFSFHSFVVSFDLLLLFPLSL